MDDKLGTLNKLISDYSERVEWDEITGTVKINGKQHLPFDKQLWYPTPIVDEEKIITVAWQKKLKL